MKGIATTFQRLNSHAPTLKYYGFSLWVVWSFSGYSGFGWSGIAPMGEQGTYTVYFASTISLIAVTLAFVLMKRHITNRLLRSTPLVIGSGLLASIGTLFLYLFGRAFFDIPLLHTIGSAFTGIGSSILYLKAGQFFGTLPPRQALCKFSQCSLVALLLYFALMGMPPLLAHGLYVLLFLFSGLLLCLDNYSKTSSASDAAEYLDTPHSIWRFFLVIAFALLLCAAEVTYYSKVSDIGNLVFVDAYTASCSLAVVCVVLLILLGTKTKLSFQDSFHPFVLVFVILYSLPLAFETMGAFSIVATSTCKFLLIAYMPSLWAFISFSGKASPIRVFGMGNIWVSIGDFIGRVAGLQFAASAFPDYSYRILVLLAIVLAFFVILVLVLPKDKLAAIIAPIADEDDEIRLPQTEQAESEAGRSEQKSLEARCAAIGEKFGLSSREQEVFYLLARGFGSNYISEQLTVSYYTVRAHTRNIYAKTGVHSRQELIELVENSK